MPTITWFDIPAKDTGRAKAFYKTLFGWEASPHPVDFAEEFFLFSTGEQGVPGGEILKRRDEGEGAKSGRTDHYPKNGNARDGFFCDLQGHRRKQVRVMGVRPWSGPLKGRGRKGKVKQSCGRKEK